MRVVLALKSSVRLAIQKKIPRLELEMETILRRGRPERNYIGARRWGIVVTLLKQLEVCHSVRDAELALKAKRTVVV